MISSRRVKHLAQREREATVALIVHLAELDERRLYLAQGYPSLFKYCTDVLHLSEHAAYNKELIARLHPQPPVPDLIRRLPARTPAARTAPNPAPLLVGAQQRPSPSRDDDTSEITLAVATSAMPAPATLPGPPARRAIVSPLAPERYKVQFTAGAELHAKLREAQALSRHQIPDGDHAKIFDRALEALLAQLHKQKLAATDRPWENQNRASGATPNSLPSSRHIPAAVRRAVSARDGGRCAFVSTDGRRCAEEAFLEFHHITPYARGGPPSVNNIELRCWAHNGYEAECHFGRWGTARVREEPEAYGPALRQSALLPAERLPTRSGTSSSSACNPGGRL